MNIGVKAPDFRLPDKDGKIFSLADFSGRRLVLYFYPKDETPGCTRQACAFAGANAEFEKLGAVVVGISKDGTDSHRKFADNHKLPFILLSDPELEAIKAYGVWQEKKLYGKPYMGVARTTFIISAGGIVEKIMEKVKPDTNTDEVLKYLKDSSDESSG